MAARFQVVQGLKGKIDLLITNQLIPLYFHLTVYNEDEGNLYVHHDILLPSFPLAAEWMSFDPGSSSTGEYALSVEILTLLNENVLFALYIKR